MINKTVVCRFPRRFFPSVSCLAALPILALVAGGAVALPDLQVELRSPDNAVPGGDVGSQTTVVVYNRGNQPVRGTESNPNGYMVDLFITRGPMPSGFARYDDNYFDGVLLKGGRISNTKSLLAGRRTAYRSEALLPSDINAGKYRLCARVDPGGKQPEADEANNTTCADLQVTQLKLVLPAQQWKAIQVKRQLPQLRLVQPELVKPLPKPVSPPKPAGSAEVSRSVLADGTLVLTFADGSQRRLRPDGVTEYVSPEGQVMVPMMSQVQGDELPVLPEGLDQWGTMLADNLMLILGNILDEQELDAYRETEEDKDYYDLVDWRLRSISFLTAQD